jgi:hypothetical protein
MGGHFGSGFHGTFISLALRYYECERDLPLVSLFPLSCQFDLRIELESVDRFLFCPPPVFIALLLLSITWTVTDLYSND